MSEWIPVSKANPKKDGRYFVTTDGNYVEIKSFAKNLRKIDKYDFDKAESGWYDYDSDFGYYKYHKVIAWMELPEPYKAKSEKQITDKKYEVKVITRGNCIICGKELIDGLFICKECENKANSRK